MDLYLSPIPTRAPDNEEDEENIGKEHFLHLRNESDSMPNELLLVRVMRCKRSAMKGEDDGVAAPEGACQAVLGPDGLATYSGKILQQCGSPSRMMWLHLL